MSITTKEYKNQLRQTKFILKTLYNIAEANAPEIIQSEYVSAYLLLLAPKLFKIFLYLFFVKYQKIIY
jgi:hypothetical protein